MKEVTTNRINNTVGKALQFKKPVQKWTKAETAATIIAGAYLAGCIVYIGVETAKAIKAIHDEHKARKEELEQILHEHISASRGEDDWEE